MVFSATDYRDTLDRAVAAPEEGDVDERTDHFDPSVGDDIAYDSNLYRLPSSVTNLTTLSGIGLNPSREDYIDSVTAGLDARWLAGNRQSIDLDLGAADNRYFRNSDLDNISSSDRLVWNWGLGEALSGQVGADYFRALAGFENTETYSRTLVNKEEYFAGGRYQVGPRWTLFGGLLDTVFDVTTTPSTYNNSRSKAVEMGAGYATNAANRFGFDYRYTDSRSPIAIVLNGTSFVPDYREERARILVTYALSEKTLVDASVGYLQRNYPATAIGSYSGATGRVLLQWQPTFKTKLVATAWQNLNAYFTAQTDYFVTKGASLSPQWVVSEKVTISLSISRENLDYVGSNPGVVVPQTRRDTLTGEMGNIVYTPTKVITLTLSAGHQLRDSNMPQFQYNDATGEASITFKF